MLSKGPLASSVLQAEQPLRYDHGRDLLWLLLRPWRLISRLLVLLMHFTGLAVRLVTQGSSTDHGVQSRLAQTVLKTLTQLGPCFIKVGQALSTRPDLVPGAWLDELTKLQDQLPAFPLDTAREMVETDLGQPVDKLFHTFPQEPIAAASLGQVYKAQLNNGLWVAVKVQRPGLEAVIRRDLVLLRLLAMVFGPALPLNLGDGLPAIVDEFGGKLFEEIDYDAEARHARRFAQQFRDNPTVMAPAVVGSHSSRRILTTVWLQGPKLRDPEELRRHGLDPTALIRTGVTAGLEQLLEHGFFHADPHPGNLIALPGRTGDKGHLGYVDFGMMDEISQGDRLIITDSIIHLINKDYESLADDFIRLGFLRPDVDRRRIVPALREVLAMKLANAVSDFNFKQVTDRFSELMYDYPFRVPARFALIIRALVSQEGVALRLDPGFRIVGVAYPYVARRLLAADTTELRDKLLDVLFDQEGRLRLERLDSLLRVARDTGDEQDVLPLASSGLRLLFTADGQMLRQRLLQTLVRDDRLQTQDLVGLLSLLQRHFGAADVAKGLAQSLWKRLNPLAV